ncbi:DDE superfamily endonuclease [Pyrenophora tritici-repentis]|nr:DDE superfamily endonuclease [Pyrenophora tritici-repentis]KAI1516666.1 DDE superfamily endonuclease [Pyrenophora tritici-repentis]KAI1676773.1 DDE superfamily endonuclease [Pyrenophora tritici-repentis]
MADKLLAIRGGTPIGKNWPERFVSRTEELKIAFNRAKDRQRILQEDPEIISPWFTLVRDTIAEYGVADDDIHNFDETGFQMGVIGSMKVVTGSERRTRPNLIQPGDREWVTVIQSICAAGYAIPPFIIYKGRVHISAWYEEGSIPYDWKLSVSKNSWTNNQLGLEWLKHFDEHTKSRQVGSYRLLILDGHESHLNQDFKDYCLVRKILTLCMPAHSSHILQPLDVVCFSPLKLKYSQRVRDLARRRVYHINKEGFLPAFKDAFFDVFTYENCKKAFEAAGLVPLDAQRVLDRLEVRLRTPPPPALPDTPWQSRTPSNTYEFGSQSKLVRESFVRSPTSAQEGFSKLVKGAEEMLHENVLIKARVRELEEQVAELTKRRGRKRRRIQTDGTIEFGAGALQVAESASTACTTSKKGGGRGSRERTQPAQRRCGNCRGTGHNARTCQKDTEEDSESDVATSYEGSVEDVE